MRTACWLGWMAALGVAGAASASPPPRSPDDVRCPPETSLVREETKHRTTLWCRRADGAPLGPHTEWYPTGQLSRLATYVWDVGRTVQDGLELAFQPNGSPIWTARYSRGKQDGEQVSWLLDGPVTQLYEDGVLLDVFRGRERPPFSCPQGLVPRVRTRERWLAVHPSPPRPPHTFIESWCEDPEVPALSPARASLQTPEIVRCYPTTEGVVSWSRGSWTDRLPFPPGFDPTDEEAVGDLCRRTDFWRDRRREGPYVSRGSQGDLHEEGSFLRGRRHGIFRVMGRACVQWRHGERVGRTPCPTGPGVEPDPWVAAQWEDLAAKTRALGWPALEAGGTNGRELRIWRYTRPSTWASWGGDGVRALRLRIASEGTTGELVAFELTEDLAPICQTDDAGACRFEKPNDRSWEDAAWELDLLDAWTLPPAHGFLIPEVAREPGTKRQGFFLEARVGGRVRRDWYGPVRQLPFTETHQTRGIADLVDALWAHYAKHLGRSGGGKAPGG